eukprot:scaffold3410_cov398-Prasinococcus_capsulatus_cf.AAC.6
MASRRPRYLRAKGTELSCQVESSGFMRPQRATPACVDTWFGCCETPCPSNVRTARQPCRLTSSLTSALMAGMSHFSFGPSFSRGESIILTWLMLSCSQAASSSVLRFSPRPSKSPEQDDVEQGQTRMAQPVVLVGLAFVQKQYCHLYTSIEGGALHSLWPAAAAWARKTCTHHPGERSPATDRGGQGRAFP